MYFPPDDDRLVADSGSISRPKFGSCCLLRSIMIWFLLETCRDRKHPNIMMVRSYRFRAKRLEYCGIECQGDAAGIEFAKRPFIL